MSERAPDRQRRLHRDDAESEHDDRSEEEPDVERVELLHAGTCTATKSTTSKTSTGIATDEQGERRVDVRLVRDDLGGDVQARAHPDQRAEQDDVAVAPAKPRSRWRAAPARRHHEIDPPQPEDERRAAERDEGRLDGPPLDLTTAEIARIVPSTTSPRVMM